VPSKVFASNAARVWGTTLGARSIPSGCAVHDLF